MKSPPSPSKTSSATTTTTNTKQSNPPKPKPKEFETCPSFRRGHLPSPTDVNRLRQLSAPHVESFNFFLERGLPSAISDIVPLELDLVDTSPNPTGVVRGEMTSHMDGYGRKVTVRKVDTIKTWLENVRVSHPVQQHPQKQQSSSSAFSSKGSSSSMKKLYPRDCRELGLMYTGPVVGDFCYQVNHRTITTTTAAASSSSTTTTSDTRAVGHAHQEQMKQSDKTMEEVAGKVMRIHKKFGDMPIMVMSKGCHLRGKNPEELMRLKEEQTEFGGYFIVNGIERCVRLLQVPRANHPTAIQRSSYKKTWTNLHGSRCRYTILPLRR